MSIFDGLNERGRIVAEDDFATELKAYDLPSIPAGGYIAGGALRDIANGDVPKDFDIFFRTQADFDNAVGLYDETRGAWLYTTKNCLAFEGEDDDVIELMSRQFGKPEEVIVGFDYTAVMAAWDGEKLTCDPKFLTDAAGRFIRLNRNRVREDSHPLHSLQRVFRRLEKGWNIEKGDFRFLLEEAARGLQDPVTLTKQNYE